MNKPFDLPTFLAKEIASATGKTYYEAEVMVKIRTTIPMKSLRSAEAKLKNIQGSYMAQASVFKNENIIVIDDLYQSGHTMNEICRALREAGANQVLGLVATKAQDLIK